MRSSGRPCWAGSSIPKIAPLCGPGSRKPATPGRTGGTNSSIEFETPQGERWLLTFGQVHFEGERAGAGKLLSGGIAVEFIINVTDRKRAEEERELLTRELSHRVRNTLAVVQSLAMQTDGRAQSVEAFREGICRPAAGAGARARPPARCQLAERRPQDAGRAGDGGLPGAASGGDRDRGRTGHDHAQARVGAEPRPARARHQCREIRRTVAA